MDSSEEKKITQYLIPANVTTKFEFFPGFGWYEFRIVLITCIIGCVFFGALSLPKKTVSETVPTTVMVQGETLPETKMEIHDKKVAYVPILIRVLFIVVPGATSFFLVKKDVSTGMSFISILSSRQEFVKKQRRYLDVYGSATRK